MAYYDNLDASLVFLWYSDFHLHKVWALVFKSSIAGTGVWWTDMSFGGKSGSLACVKFEDVFLYISVLKGSLDAL